MSRGESLGETAIERTKLELDGLPMKKVVSRGLWAVGAAGLVAGVVLYARGDERPVSALGPSGALRLEVSVGDPNVHTITATITGNNGFEPQTHRVRVLPGRPVSTTLIGGLPVGTDYEVTLEGAPCHGASSFEVKEDKVAGVTVRLDCPVKQTTVVAFDDSQPHARCGDNVINQAEEECDGTALPAKAPPGSRCSYRCTLIMPNEENKCAQCTKEKCSEPRAGMETEIGKAGPIVECVLGDKWKEGGRASVKSCANSDLLTCYCGSMRAEDCANAPPSSVPGPCVAEILAGTGCDSSMCVAGKFMNGATPNGKAMRFIQCTQDMCYDSCFN